MNVNHARNTLEIKCIENDETKKIIADTHHQLKEAVGRGVDHAILEYRGSPGTMADAIRIQHQAGVDLLEVFGKWAATFEALPSSLDARETIETDRGWRFMKHKETVELEDTAARLQARRDEEARWAEKQRVAWADANAEAPASMWTSLTEIEKEAVGKGAEHAEENSKCLDEYNRCCRAIQQEKFVADSIDSLVQNITELYPCLTEKEWDDWVKDHPVPYKLWFTMMDVTSSQPCVNRHSGT